MPYSVVLRVLCIRGTRREQSAMGTQKTPVQPGAEETPYIPDEIRVVKEHHDRKHIELSQEELRQSRSFQLDSPWRGLIIGLVGVFVICVTTIYADLYLSSSCLAETYLPTGVFLVFLGLLGVNTLLDGRILGRFSPERAFGLTAPELMLAYTTMLAASFVPTTGFAQRVVPHVMSLYYYATPVNEWQIVHWGKIPSWLVPQGEGVVDWFFQGLPVGESIPWSAWIVPLSMWTILAVALYMIMFSLTLVLRKRWMDAERLQFPLAQIPLTLIGDDQRPTFLSGIFRRPIFWAGVAVPFVLHAINGLNVYFPAIPTISLVDLRLADLLAGSRFMTEPPFRQWADVRFNFYWSVIGISYLLRSEVSLSVWFFEWFYNFEEIVFEVSGLGYGQHNWSPLHTFGYSLMARYQRVGALVVVSCALFWASRKEIMQMIRAGLSGKTDRHASDIPAWGLWMLVAGLGTYFTWMYATGINTMVSLLLLLFFFLVSLTTARIVAATGLLWVFDHFVPMHGVAKMMGTARINPHSFTNMGLVDSLALNQKANIMPQILDGMRISRLSGIRQRHFIMGAMAGLGLAILVSVVMVLWMAYGYGGINLQRNGFTENSNWLFNRLKGFQVHRVFTDWTVLGCMVTGGGFMSVLMFMHRAFLWWPLYPLGFIIGGTVASSQIWFPVFLGWILKLAAIRFGGTPAYNRLKDIALGLIVGEFTSVGIWLIIDALTGTLDHKVFPV